MKSNFAQRRGGLSALSLLAAVCAAAPASANGPHSHFRGGPPMPAFVSGGFGMSGVTMNVSQQGGVSVNIANVGASGTFFGWPMHGSHPGQVGTNLAGIPGFVGGHVFGGNGMNGLNVLVGGGQVMPGGVSVNIANVALNNTFIAGYPWSHTPPHRYRTRPSSGGPGGDSGGADAGGAGDGSGGSDGAGAY